MGESTEPCAKPERGWQRGQHPARGGNHQECNIRGARGDFQVKDATKVMAGHILAWLWGSQPTVLRGQRKNNPRVGRKGAGGSLGHGCVVLSCSASHLMRSQ